MTEITNTTPQTSSLEQFYRQPAIYITLPSKGKWYDDKVLTPTETGEYPVYPMTARDEMLMKTPDALMGGNATVDVIQSCMPNFKNAWDIVNFDIDSILIAIRIATYGETMNIKYNVPVANEEAETTVNISALLEDVRRVTIQDEFTTKIGLKVKIGPLRYREMNRVQIAQFEQQKIYANLSMNSITDDEKSKQFAKSYRILNDINFNMLSDSVIEITTPKGQTASGRDEIKNFINNCNAVLAREIEDKVAEIRRSGQMRNIKIKATEEQIKKGVPATYDIPLTFDNSNFFG